MHEVFSALRAHARNAPDRIAVHCIGGGTLSYAELASAVSNVSRMIPNGANTIALAGPPSLAWIVADLAVTLRGRWLVPLPFFFSAEQSAHILSQAGVDAVIDTGTGADMLHPVLRFDDHDIVSLGTSPADLPVYTGGAERIIFTSGTTGRPKGVRHGDRQIDHAVTAIAAAAGAQASDHHLSLLPPALLLEQVAGTFVPILKGAEIVLAPAAAMSSLTGAASPMAAAIDEQQPTTTILVPAQLRALVRHAEETGWRAPESLRMVAVGGAPVSERIVAAARGAGLPVSRGYGLSECCSVVSVERPDTIAQATGDMPSSGRPIPGMEVRIDDGEIVVSGPGVMAGYLGQGSLDKAEWRTGDLGRIEADGRITVLGRRDRCMVLESGRNVSPEWIETEAMAGPGILSASASTEDRRSIRVALKVADDAAVDPVTLTGLFDRLPDYARPTVIEVTRGNDSRRYDLTGTETGLAEAV